MAVLVAVTVVVTGLVMSPAAAQTTICSGVSVSEVQKCDPGWAANMSFMHWRMYGGHNCTNYVAYRLGRDGVPEPSYLLGNANTWASRAKSHGVRVDSTPEVGAVGAWPGRNHVVYIDEVGPGYLITSEDNWPGYYPKGMYRKIKVTKGESAYPTQYIHFKGKTTINGPLPTVAGTAKVGSTLTATAGTWTPSDVTLKYQWLRDGVIITGATKTSYTITTADIGHAMTISVTGSKSGLTSRTASSTPTAKVVDEVKPKVITPGAPAVAGAEQMMVGDWLTADPGTWGPDGVELGYQWFRGDHAVSSATTTRYKVTDADLGKRLVVKVTGRKSGYPSVTAVSEPTAKAVKTGIHSTPAPKISGEVRTGEWLMVDPGTWGPDGVELSYQWFRGDHAVSSGTNTRYKVSTADLGKKLSVTVTGRKKSLTTVSKTSEPTAAAKATPVLDASAAGDKGKAVVTLIVTAPTVPVPTGFGTVSEGSKTLKTLDLAIGRPGRATLRVTLSKGTHTLTVSYSGSETVAPGSTTVKVKVS
ncbi:CHAP domain-containing protein [Aeromicrobium sp.]|uniref:CHAP domain-containing protein n=1 Tax=Aeromicrobium sp. TaxID=1871063 RepID=UPI003C6EDB92